MKLVSIASAGASLAVSHFLPVYGLLFVVVLALGFALFGIARSIALHRNPLNDAPNALRVFLAALGGFFLSMTGTFITPSLGVVSIAVGVMLNDEYQRRAFRSVQESRRGGTVALLGIDGSGKSTHARALMGWLAKRGYHSSDVPFHQYLFLTRLTRRQSGDLGALAIRRSGNPLRPILSLLDNFTLFLKSAAGARMEGRVVVYDRYIWSTYVKYAALGYPTRPLRWLYLLPRPTLAVVLDIPVTRALDVIDSRSGHIPYRTGVLAAERREYLEIARKRGYPVLDSTRDFEAVQGDIERLLAKAFPK